MSVPASQLKGMTLPNDWKVVEELKLTGSMTGSTFSFGYLVEKDDGSTGFLKALDYSKALKSSDPPAILNAMTQAFLFERNLLEKCRSHRMNRIVTAIDSGSVLVDKTRQDGTVSYLIFEKAEGDVRKQMDILKKVDEAWILRVMHHISVALNQLHLRGIAHQDVKPSNILIFKSEGSKLGDLGSACEKNNPFSKDNLEIAGDPEYAPPELLYRYISPDWNMRRFGCDAYLLGSMLVFLFSKTNINALVMSQLNDIHKPNIWKGTFDNLLIYLRTAFGSALQLFENDVPPLLKADILEIIRELCDPDPRERGIKKNRGTIMQYSMEYYTSRFNTLAEKAELLITKERIK